MSLATPTPRRHAERFAASACAALLVVACGGGSGGGTTPPPPPPPTALFTDVTATHVPAGVSSQRCMDAQPLDFDGDGDLDLALAIENNSNALLSNDGTGRFTNVSAGAGMLANNQDHEDVALADLDGDLDLDLAFAAEDTQVHELYLDQGVAFSGSQLAQTSVANAVVAFDYEGDGDRDLLFGGDNLLLLLNDGSAGFSSAAPGSLPPNLAVTQDLVAVDVDNDGDLDLALGNEGQDQLFLNGGGGSFSDVTATHLPAVFDETRVLAFADIDGDGDPDMFVGNVSQELVGGALQNFLYLNDGSGHFAAAAPGTLPFGFGTYGGRFVDFDADGDPDLALANADLLDATHIVGYQLLRNQAGVFSDITPLAFNTAVAEHGFGVAAGDFNADGKVDLYLCSRGASAGAQFLGSNDRLMLQN